MAGIDHVIFMQRNSLNRRDRTLKIEAWNESFDTRLKINEFCYYSVRTFLSFHTFFLIYYYLEKGSGLVLLMCIN